MIKAKAIIDGIGSKPLDNAAVVIEGSTIKAVEQQGQQSLPEGPHVKMLDFPNGSLLPGLVDAHTHLIFGSFGSSYEEVMNNDSDEIMLLRAAKNALTHLTCGVTTMRENGARNRVTFDLPDAAPDQPIARPHVRGCAPLYEGERRRAPTRGQLWRRTCARGSG